MKKTTLILSFILISLFAFAQAPADTSYWKKGGIGTLAFSQVSLFQWAAGGENSFSGAALVILFASFNINFSFFPAEGI